MKSLKADGKELPAWMEEKVVDLVRNYNDAKKTYVEMQNDALYEKWELNKKKDRSENTQTNIIAYVTFKSMMGKDVAQKIFTFAEKNAKEDEAENEK